MNSSNKVSSKKLLLVGKVIKPHGFRGLMRVWSYARSKNSFLYSGIVFFKHGDQEPVKFTVLDIKPHKNFFLMHVKEIDTIEKADSYRGADIFVDKDHLTRNDDEYYWFELIGLKVYLDTGEYLGIIKEIIPTGSNDVYVVKQNNSEFLIPAIYDVVKKIDLDKGEMIITAIDGLLDLNEV
ncbi:MAG: 16S rRNA processing protein RimM [Deltaproteobacteria bacterium]|nr:16S rRNA processing protein RimM [Deltaproteobacteria bacterium]